MRKKQRDQKRRDTGRYQYIFSVALVVFVLDQLTKHFASRIKESIPIIKGVFHLTLVKNTGATWGILQDQQVFLTLISVFIIMLVFFFLKEFEDKLSINTALAFLLGGTFGNLIDRLTKGYVIDFLDFRIWPVFNIADSFVFVGALFLIYYLFYEKNEKKS